MRKDQENFKKMFEQYLRDKVKEEMRPFDEEMRRNFKDCDLKNPKIIMELKRKRKEMYKQKQRELKKSDNLKFFTENIRATVSYENAFFDDSSEDENEECFYKKTHGPYEPYHEFPQLSKEQIEIIEKRSIIVDQQNEDQLMSTFLGPYEGDIENMKVIYLGQYFKGWRHGVGKMYLDDGSFIEGDFVKDLPEGFVRIISEEGNFFEGNIEKVDNKNYIKGILGTLKEGFEENDGDRGLGIAFYENGSKYEGAFKNEKRHGYGEMYDCNGGVYKGFWLEDKMHGKGFYCDNKKTVFQEVWKRGNLMNKIEIIPPKK